MSTQPQWLAAGFFLVFAAAYGGVRVFFTWARRRNHLDIPNERSSHAAPTPHGGGSIFVLAALGFTAIFAILNRQPALLWFVLAAAGIAVVSWWDDRHPLPSVVRLFVHLAAALAIVLAFGDLKTIQLPLLGIVSIGGLGVVITLFWITGLTNAYNFMDGIDGIAGLQALVTTLGWLLTGFWFQNLFLIWFSVVLAAAVLGFLIHNWSPASVFMGDVGSAFLGFTFAALPFVAFKQAAAPLPGSDLIQLLFVTILLLWPFIFDTTFTFAGRLYRRENVLAAHRSHLYQRLIIQGFSHRQVTLLYGALAGWGLVLVLLFLGEPTLLWIIAFPSLLGMAIGLWYFVRTQERGSV